MTFLYNIDIQNDGDWYNISVQHVVQNGGGSLLSKYNGSLVDTLNALYSNKWSKWNFSEKQGLKHNISKGQVMLFALLKRTLFQHQVLLNFKHPDLYYQTKRSMLEFDVSYGRDLTAYQLDIHPRLVSCV